MSADNEGDAMQILNDDALIEAYRVAVCLQLEEDFIKLLQQELQRRGLDDRVFRSGNHEFLRQLTIRA